MGVKNGYKQTEVGVIPEDWDVMRLGRLATFKTGPFGSALHRSDYVPDGIPVVNPMQIMDGNIVPTRSMAITEEAARKLSDFRLEAGNIVIGRRGDMGRCAFVKPDQDGWLCGTGSMMIRTGPSLDAAFTQRLLSSPPIIAEIENASVGTTMINLNQGTLGNLLVPLPPTKGEQEAIAEALSDADALIESQEQLLAKKRHIKQGATQDLLTGKRRLPGFRAGSSYKHTEVGEIPEDWEVKRLGHLFEITSSKRVFQSEWRNEGVPFFRAREVAILCEKGVVDNDLFISRAMYEAFRRLHGVPQVGDLLVTGVGTLGKVYVVSDDREFYFKDGNIIWFKLAGSIQTEFLQQLFLTPLLLKQIMDSSAGTTVGTYTISGAKKTAVPYPTEDEQAAIAAVLSDMDAEIAALETKLTKAHHLKTGMMQELLTGRIRLL